MDEMENFIQYGGFEFLFSKVAIASVTRLK